MPGQLTRALVTSKPGLYRPLSHHGLAALLTVYLPLRRDPPSVPPGSGDLFFAASQLLPRHM